MLTSGNESVRKGLNISPRVLSRREHRAIDAGKNTLATVRHLLYREIGGGVHHELDMAHIKLPLQKGGGVEA